jgi:rsbT antagonist protein RsbS
VVVSVQVDLTPRVLAQLQADVLDFTHEHDSAAVLVDVAGVTLLDAEDFEALRAMLRMVRLLGARPILSGLRPGVVSALVELGVDFSGVETALDLDDAFARVEGGGSLRRSGGRG